MEEQNIKIKFDSNAKEATVETVKLGTAIDNVTEASDKHNKTVATGTEAINGLKKQLKEANAELQRAVKEYGANSEEALKASKAIEELGRDLELTKEASKSLKTQLKEANAELQRSIQLYGETSAETIKSAKAVAELKDQMGFAKDLSEQFNPDQKFKALGAATNLAGTGLTGVTAGMALFGDQSKATEAQLLKVQSAMAFSEALSGLSDIGDQFAILKTTLKNAWTTLTTAKVVDTVATEANAVAENQSFLAKTKNVIVTGAMSVATGIATGVQWLWNTAIMANPLVAFAVVLATATAGVYYLTKSLMASSAEAKASERANTLLNKSIDNQEKAYEKASKSTANARDLALGLARANGKSSSEIRKLETALLNQEIAERRLNTEKLRSIAVEAQRVAGLEDATDAQKETAKKAIEAFKKSNEALKNNYDEKTKLRIAHTIAEAQEETDAHNKSLEKQKEANKKLAQERKDARDKKQSEKDKEKAKEIQDKIDLDKSISDSEKNRLKELQDLNDATEQEKLNRQKERDLAEIEALKAKGGDVANLMALHDEKYTTLQSELDKKNADKKLADKLAFDEAYYLGIKEYSDAKNQEELDALYNHKLALLQIEEDAKLLEIENNGGLSKEEKKEQEAQVRAYYDQREIDEKTAKEEKLLAIKDKVRARLKDNADKVLGDLAKGAIKNKEIQKAAIITEGAIGVGKAIKNTAQAVSEDLKLGFPQNIPPIALDIAVGASSLASIVSGTNQALQAVGGGSIGGGGSGSMPTAPTMPSQASPTVAFNNTAENQIGQAVTASQVETPPLKVYVVESEITEKQNTVKAIVNNNTI